MCSEHTLLSNIHSMHEVGSTVARSRHANTCIYSASIKSSSNLYLLRRERVGVTSHQGCGQGTGLVCEWMPYIFTIPGKGFD